MKRLLLFQDLVNIHSMMAGVISGVGAYVIGSVMTPWYPHWFLLVLAMVYGSVTTYSILYAWPKAKMQELAEHDYHDN